ncbi:MAG: septum formation initiator family protein [Verrucomicrobiales bacterium]|nr:septum formation initiator family protein [Verrucomicrobiales bacterium]
MSQRHTDFQEDFESPLQFDRAEPAQSRTNIWQHLSRVMEVSIYVCGLLAVGKLFWPEVQKQEKLNQDLAQLDTTVVEKQAEVAQLRLEYELLKNDRQFLESVARDRLNLMRDDEYVIRIERGGSEDGEKGSR